MRSYAILLMALTLAACAPGMPRGEAVSGCISLCQEALKTAVLDSQCLGVLDSAWVCDVAHNPRAAQDNLAENQCASYRNGSHRRFVEVTANCTLIRTG